MLSIVKSLALIGVEGFIIDVQVDVSGGIPCWEIVGLPDTSVKEAKERVRTAIKNSNFKFPSRRIVINLAPTNIRKAGSSFDLPIAIALLQSCGVINNYSCENTIFIGELGLDGGLNRVNGVLPICIEARKKGFKRVIIPNKNKLEAELVEGIDIIPVDSLDQLVLFLNNQLVINPVKSNVDEIFKKTCAYSVDFSEVKGQKNIKRAVEVATAGAHNLLLIGSPGSGKTMIAKRIPTILPNLTLEESLEVTKIHSIAGLLDENIPLLVCRPFIEPHHTISKASLIGGGTNPKPGDISLANYGVLFLDELPEFNKDKLETLRGPLEDRKITISRLNSTSSYPCNFMLVASMNPCPCGYYGFDSRCNCSENTIRRYLGKISGPILDRIDIQVEVSSVEMSNYSNDNGEESSQQIKERVSKARLIQQERYKNEKIFSNCELTDGLIKKYCRIDSKCEQVLDKFIEKNGLSARAYTRIIKVARTIADLEESKEIEMKHLLEAMQYRNLDRKYRY